MEKIDPKEKVCFNCKHLAWLIGIGQGLKCFNERKDNKYVVIPSSMHTCEMFEYKKKSNKPR